MNGTVTYIGKAWDETGWNVSEPSKSHAGEYTMTLTIENPNYCFENSPQTIVANEKLVVQRYTVNSIIWAERSFIYNGESQDDGNFATAEGVNGDGTLDLSETIKQNEQVAAFINAGSYTFTASLTTKQAHNYVFAREITLTNQYKIGKKSLTVVWTDVEETYSGKEWKPTYSISDDSWCGGDKALYTIVADISGDDGRAINAGNYHSALSLKRSDGGIINYELEYSETDFTVTKRNISIAFDTSIKYGEAMPVFSGVYKERVTGGSYAEGEKFADLGIEVSSVSSSDYAQGKGVGGYTVQWQFTGKSKNYNVVRDEGVLTVVVRNVQIEIKDATSEYGESLSELTWDITRESMDDIYIDEIIFTLHIDKKGSIEEYLAAGKYAIYAEKTALADNYKLEFIGSWQESGEYQGKAGTYTVEQADLEMSVKTPSDLNYDGEPKEYSATTDTAGVAISPKYYKDNGDGERAPLSDAPVNVGHYFVEFVLDNPNFTAAAFNTDFTITPRHLSVRITANGGKYSGSAYDATISFGNSLNKEPLIAGEDYTVQYSGTMCDKSDYNSEIAPVNAGNYTVTVQVINPNYTGSGSAKFTVSQIELTVTAKDSNVQYGNELSAFEVGYSGFVNKETEEVLKGELVFTTRDTASSMQDTPYAPGWRAPFLVPSWDLLGYRRLTMLGRTAYLLRIANFNIVRAYRRVKEGARYEKAKAGRNPGGEGKGPCRAARAKGPCQVRRADGAQSTGVSAAESGGRLFCGPNGGYLPGIGHDHHLSRHHDDDLRDHHLRHRRQRHHRRGPWQEKPRAGQAGGGL